jgi:hypothetical protein
LHQDDRQLAVSACLIVERLDGFDGERGMQPELAVIAIEICGNDVVIILERLERSRRSVGQRATRLARTSISVARSAAERRA